MKRSISFESLCVKDGADKLTTKPHQMPIYATSSFEFSSIEEGIDIFTGKSSGHVYGRYGNPTIDSIAQKIADMEGFGLDIEPFGLMCSSGMSAISTVIMALTNQGDKILTQGNLYGGTTELFKSTLARFGVTPIFTNLSDRKNVKATLKAHPEIKVIYLETPTNPTISVLDLKEIADLARANDILTVVDNTFCTPYLQQPFKFGIDFSIHSTTKYLNGHGNSISGLIVGKDQSHHQAVWKCLKLMGTNCNPFDAWMLNIGIKTLKLRMDKHSSNAMAVAEYLEQHSAVAKVNYCGLPSHPQHSIAQKQMSQFSGMLSFEIVGGIQAGISFMNKIKFATLAPTLGDVDTLILHPASMSHLNVDKEIRERNGITDGLIRLSVGIESVEDIIADLEQAL